MRYTYKSRLLQEHGKFFKNLPSWFSLMTSGSAAPSGVYFNQFTWDSRFKSSGTGVPLLDGGPLSSVAFIMWCASILHDF